MIRKQLVKISVLGDCPNVMLHLCQLSFVICHGQMSVIVCRIYVGITGKNFSCLSYILLSEYLFEISQMLKKVISRKQQKTKAWHTVMKSMAGNH